MVELASPYWSELSQEEKDQYNNRAKQIRGVDGGPASDRAGRGGMDSLGRPLADIEARDMEEKRIALKKIEDLYELIQREVENDNLENAQFYVIHANIFAKIMPEKGKIPMFVPAEIAVSKFSLRGGLTGSYQAFPYPGKPPMGSKRGCLEMADKLQIPFAPDNEVSVLSIVKKL